MASTETAVKLKLNGVRRSWARARPARDRWRERLYRHLDVTAWDKPGLSPTNVALMALIIASVVLFAIETEPSLGAETQRLATELNHAILFLFAIEYFVRLWVSVENPRFSGAGGRWRFSRSPHAVLDLASFAPELIAVIAMWFLGGDMESLAALRVLRFARLLRMVRYIESADIVVEAIQKSWRQILSTMFLSFLVLYALALLLYFFERHAQPEAFASLPRAAWASAAQLTTLKGGATPITFGGRIVSFVAAILSLGVVALPAGIFANAFRETLTERRAQALEAAARKAVADAAQRERLGSDDRASVD